MNKRCFWHFALGSLIVASTAAGCSKLPEQRIDEAQSALDAAGKAQAEAYATQAYDDAEQAFADAMAEVDAQKSTFVLTRSYTKAAEMLIRAKDLADAAKQKAIDGREEWKQNAQNLIQEARADVDKARDAAKKARRAATRRDLEATADKAATALYDAEKAFDAGNYVEAHARAEDAKTLADVDEEEETPTAKKRPRTSL